ncbi:hypothetical protein MRX96_019995 [Rhipicephalus microplus]
MLGSDVSDGKRLYDDVIIPLAKESLNSTNVRASDVIDSLVYFLKNNASGLDELPRFFQSITGGGNIPQCLCGSRFYDNIIGSSLLFEARAGALCTLEYRRKFDGTVVSSNLRRVCAVESEMQEHLVRR